MYAGIAMITNDISTAINTCTKNVIIGSIAPNSAITEEGATAIAIKKIVGIAIFDVVSNSIVLLSFWKNTIYPSPTSVNNAIHGRNDDNALGIVIAWTKIDVIF